MRLALYTLLFLGSVLLVLDLKKKVDQIPKPIKPTQTQASQPARPSSNKSESSMPQGHPNIQQTLAQYTQAIQASPDNASAYINRANAYIANRQFTEALADFDKALTIEPQNTAYILQRGAVFLKLKQDDKAVQSFTQALKIDPDFTNARIYRAITHFRNDHFQPALDDCLTLLKKDPKFTDLHVTIAQCYKGLHQDNKARQHLDLYLQTTKDLKGKQQAEELKKRWETSEPVRTN